jgi:hypothetical protein
MSITSLRQRAWKQTSATRRQSMDGPPITPTAKETKDEKKPPLTIDQMVAKVNHLAQTLDLYTFLEAVEIQDDVKGYPAYLEYLEKVMKASNVKSTALDGHINTCKTLLQQNSENPWFCVEHFDAILRGLTGFTSEIAFIVESKQYKHYSTGEKDAAHFYLDWQVVNRLLIAAVTKFVDKCSSTALAKGLELILLVNVNGYKEKDFGDAGKSSDPAFEKTTLVWIQLTIKEGTASFHGYPVGTLVFKKKSNTGAPVVDLSKQEVDATELKAPNNVKMQKSTEK